MYGTLSISSRNNSVISAITFNIYKISTKTTFVRTSCIATVKLFFYTLANVKRLGLGSTSARDPPALVAGSLRRSSSAHRQPWAQPLPAQGLRFLSSLCFLNLSLLSDSLLRPPLLFLPWRRRLGERRRHLSCLRPALCRRRAHPPGMPTPSLYFCCARRSTPNPNKSIYIRI
jgi:hypothetical protein